MIRKPKNSSNFHYRFNFKGQTFSGTTGTSNRTLANQYEDKMRNEIFKKIELGIIDPEHVTLSKAIDTYFDDTKHEKTIKTYHVFKTKTLGTKLCNRTGKKLHVHGLPDIAIDMLKDRDIQQLITRRRGEGNSTATIIYELVFLSVVFKHAKRLGYPVPKIDWEELKKANKLRPSKGRLRFLTGDEEKKLLLELAVTMPNDTPLSKMQRMECLHFTVMLLDIGCRHGELANLKWSDLDLEAKTIRLYRTKVQNESVLSMTNRVHTILTNRLLVKAADQDFVFEGRKGGPLLNTRKSFKTACERAGIADVSFHTLRHTFASRLVQNNVSLYTVQQLLGHTSSATTERYAHLTPGHAAVEAANVLNGLQGD